MNRNEMMSKLAENPSLRFKRKTEEHGQEYTVVTTEDLWMHTTFDDEGVSESELTHQSFTSFVAYNEEDQAHLDQFSGGGVGTPIVERLAFDDWELVS